MHGEFTICTCAHCRAQNASALTFSLLIDVPTARRYGPPEATHTAAASLDAHAPAR